MEREWHRGTGPDRTYGKTCKVAGAEDTLKKKMGDSSEAGCECHTLMEFNVILFYVKE